MKQPDNVKAVSNDEVRAAFVRREPAHAANLVSTGDKLLSYGWYEIAAWYGDKVWLRSGNLYSQTTKSKHMSGLVTRLYAARIRYESSPVESEFDEGAMAMPDIWRDYAKNEGSDTYYVVQFYPKAFENGFVVEQSLTFEQAQWLVDNSSMHHAPAVDSPQLDKYKAKGE